MSDKKQKILRPDEMPEFRNQVPHSTHSLNHGSAITATCSHLMPVFYDFMNAGEVIDVSIPFELITEPLVSYAQARIVVHTEYFFVPMELIYQPFGDWYYNIRSQYSSMFGDDVERKLPTFDLDGAQLFAKDHKLDVGVNTGSDIECFGRRFCRLFDLLDYGSEAVFGGYDPATDPKTDAVIFPYGLAAYNCIYQYFYRLDNRQKFSSRSFNFDRFYQTGQIILTNDEMYQFASIKYRPKDNDYFTDCKVSPIVDVLNLNVKTELAAADSWLTRSKNSVNSPTVSSGSAGDASTSGFAGWSNPSGYIQTKFGNVAGGANAPVGTAIDLSTANIRAMFASEKLWSITGRAKKHYDDQTLAHFGFKVPHDPKHQISRFGHDVTTLDIGMVIATGASADTPLGEIAGKGRANGSATHRRFTAPCHGVVMAIMSIVPDLYYYDYRAKYTMVRDRSDFFTPEYDHLGMQPLFGYECGYGTDGAHDTQIMGWQYRYEQWKRRFNKVSNAFGYLGTRKTWMVATEPHYGSVIPGGPNREDYLAFMHSPYECNSIFVPQYSGLWSTSFDDDRNSAALYDLDPFNITMHIQASLRSEMSDYSLPRLDA